MDGDFNLAQPAPRKSYDCSVVWLRRDLRLDDNVALGAAAACSRRIALAFVLDPPLLRGRRVGAPIVQFFFDALGALRAELRKRGSDLVLLSGEFAPELLGLVARLTAQAVFYNEDYEPAARRRDADVTRALQSAGLDVHHYTDHVYASASDVRQKNGAPYKMFTPYRRKWDERYASDPRMPVASAKALRSKLLERDALGPSLDIPQPEAIGYARSALYPRSGEREGRALLKGFTKAGGAIEQYAAQRNIPSLAGTSGLSPHLRAGTIGIRLCVAQARDPVWRSELAWRDFYQMILREFPHVESEPFLPSAAQIRWRESPSDFERWCTGQTGYPIVDAAMVQLNTTGWMHNRLRMIVASFLTKHLLIDWRLGERYFEQHLADADLAANNGGWQWSASTGNDAVPYFRIFNPIIQSRTFDPEGVFIKAMLPQLRDVSASAIHEPWKFGVPYHAPIVDHAQARARALAEYYRAMGPRTR